jgi:hypothetical protein
MKSKVSLGRANTSDEDDEHGDSKTDEGSDLLDMIAEAVKSVDSGEYDDLDNLMVLS